MTKTKQTNTDKTKKTQSKNGYRMRFTLPNGQMVQHTAHTKAMMAPQMRYSPGLLSRDRMDMRDSSLRIGGFLLPTGKKPPDDTIIPTEMV